MVVTGLFAGDGMEKEGEAPVCVWGVCMMLPAPPPAPALFIP